MYDSDICNFAISSGVGISKYKLVSFDNALLDAGFSNYNLVKISSILPSKCCQRDQITKPHGSPLLTAYASISSDQIGQEIATAVAVGIPSDDNEIGVIMEHSGYCDQNTAQKTVCAMVEEAMNNHGIKVKKIISSSIGQTVQSEEYTTVFSGIAIW